MAKNKLEGVDLIMRAGGYYSAATRGARAVIDNATPLVLETIYRLPDCGASTVFTMTDMGCADGTSLDLVRRVIAAVRNRWPDRPICIVYTDQPRNDYNSLFQIVHGLTPLRSYLAEFEGVHVLASATSFYRQMIPAGTLDLGFSATAMHLAEPQTLRSDRPCPRALCCGPRRSDFRSAGTARLGNHTDRTEGGCERPSSRPAEDRADGPLRAGPSRLSALVWVGVGECDGKS
jgi:hypothetical protein